MACKDTTNPNLQLFFKGLFTFCFNQDIVYGTVPEATECQVGVLSTAPGHQLKITIVKEETVGDPPILIPEISSIDIHPTLGRRFRYITLETPEDLEGVTCEKKDVPPNRTGDPSDDFRWIIDFERGEFHNSKLNLLEGIFLPIISIRTGRFYTDLITERDYVQIKGNRITKPVFGKVAEVIRTNITLPPGSHFALNLGGTPLVADELADDKKRYRIYFENSCPRLRKQGNKPTVAVRPYLENNVFLLELLGALNINKDIHKNLLGDDAVPAGSEDELILEDEQAEEVLAEEPSDIQYYYHGFDKRPLEWFDLRVLPDGRGVRPAICYPSFLGRTFSLPTAGE